MRRHLLPFALCAALAGCALPYGTFKGEDTAPPFREPAMTVQQAGAAITPGQSTKEQVIAALGPANVVRFDSGYEVWVYRTPAAMASAKSEFIVLFTPQGVVKKTRVRSPAR